MATLLKSIILVIATLLENSVNGAPVVEEVYGGRVEREDMMGGTEARALVVLNITTNYSVTHTNGFVNVQNITIILKRIQ